MKWLIRDSSKSLCGLRGIGFSLCGFSLCKVKTAQAEAYATKSLNTECTLPPSLAAEHLVSSSIGGWILWAFRFARESIPRLIPPSALRGIGFSL
jgi:hypothetical protein